MNDNKYVLMADFEDGCDIHDCENTSTGLWHGISTEDGDVHYYTATYCKQHEMNHADPADYLAKIGLIEKQE